MSLARFIAPLLMPACVWAAPDTAHLVLADGPQGSHLTEPLAWLSPGSDMMIADPIVYPRGLRTDWVSVPQRPAQFFLVIEPEFQSPVAAILQFSAAAAHCTRSMGRFGVDSGSGAFVNRDALQSLDAYLPTLPEGWSLYDGLWYDQSAQDSLSHFLLTLPDGASLPAFITGGDGGFEGFEVRDAAGNTAAVLTVFSNDISLSRLLSTPCP